MLCESVYLAPLMPLRRPAGLHAIDYGHRLSDGRPAAHRVEPSRSLSRRRLVDDDLVAEVNTLVADVDAWPCDQLAYFALRLPAERASQRAIDPLRGLRALPKHGQSVRACLQRRSGLADAPECKSHRLRDGASTVRRPLPTPGRHDHRHPRRRPSEYDAVDFLLRLLSYHL